jgi:hypothetical protein
MSIGILASSYSFLVNFKNDNKCQTFIDNLDYFVRIKDKTHEYFNRHDILCTDRITYKGKCWEDSLLNKYNRIYYYNTDTNNLGEFNTKEDILNKLKKEKEQNIFYNKILNNEAEILTIEQKYIDKYAKYFKDMKYRKTKGSRSNAHAGIYVLLTMLSKYPDHKIYLIGFNYSEDYCVNGKSLPSDLNEAKERRQETDKIVAHCPILNDFVLNDIIKTHDNVFVKNSF